MDNINYFFFGEPGLGNLFGGYGLIFWGLSFPAFLYLMGSGISVLWSNGKTFSMGGWVPGTGSNWFPSLFWGQLGLGLLALFLYAHSQELLLRSGRLVLFVTGLGLLALAVVWPKLSFEIQGAEVFLKTLCISSSVLGLILMGNFRDPQFDLREAIQDRMAGKSPSPYHYFYLGNVLKPLEILTQGERGLSVYVSGPRKLFWTAPFYGVNLQNRIWNFEKAPSAEPDAFVFHQTEEDQDLFYLGRRISPREVTLDSRYMLIFQDSNALFFLKKSLLDHPGRKTDLERYYEGIYPELNLFARRLTSQIHSDGVILTSSPLGYSLKHLELKGDISQTIIFVPNGMENEFGKTLPEKIIFSLKRPLEGFNSEVWILFSLPEGEFQVFKNERP
ncbi:MAG TPA: hypothetical protein VGB26_05025 [Nitrospiria bacterium]